jgi:hypothetical protein
VLDASTASPAAVVAEAIDAWRTWTLAGSRDGVDVLLYPIAGTGKAWPCRFPVRGECGRRQSHAVPGLECSCGIHATHTTDLLRRTRDPSVLGTVALWGRVAEHEYGWRAEFGYPQRLGLICQLCFWQRGALGSNACDVVVRHRGGRMIPLCVPHLDLCRRYGYPVRRVIDALGVERALLEAYAVDLLRFSIAPADSPAGIGDRAAV